MAKLLFYSAMMLISFTSCIEMVDQNNSEDSEHYSKLQGNRKIMNKDELDKKGFEESMHENDDSNSMNPYLLRDSSPKIRGSSSLKDIHKHNDDPKNKSYFSRADEHSIGSEKERKTTEIKTNQPQDKNNRMETKNLRTEKESSKIDNDQSVPAEYSREAIME